MRHTLVAVVLAAACATPGAPRPPSRASDRASTDAVNRLIRGDYAGALARAERALVDDGDNAWLLYERGLALAGLGRLDDALAALDQAEHRFDSDWGRSLAIYRRALALEFAGRCAEASTEYSHYAALVRASEPRLAADAMAHLSFCLGPTPEQEAARVEAAQLVAAEGETRRLQAEEASTAAVRALATGDYQSALAQAEAGLALAPDDPWLLYNKGMALAGLERTDEALATLRAAERRFDAYNLHGRSVAIYRRAIALEVAGRCDEERAELEKYAALVSPARPELAQHALGHIKFCRLANGKTL